MYLLYLDESGFANLANKRIREASDFFILGGVIVKETEHDNCHKSFMDFKSKNFPKEISHLPIHAVELNQISRCRRCRYKDHLTEEEGKKLLKKTYEFLSSLPIETIAIVIDNHNLKKQYVSPENPYKLAYSYILEKFHKIVMGREEPENRFGIVNLAESSIRAQKNLKQIHEVLLKDGTQYVKDFNSIFRKLNIDKYDNSPFFEIADLICYAYQRSYYGWLCKNLEKPFVDEEFLKLIEKICTLKIGSIRIDGIRLKVFPYPRFVKMKSRRPK